MEINYSNNFLINHKNININNWIEKLIKWLLLIKDLKKIR